MDARRVFADTSALYALVDSRDEHHAVASEVVGG
jgi:predicted nucleic acid-binding protein